MPHGGSRFLMVPLLLGLVAACSSTPPPHSCVNPTTSGGGPGNCVDFIASTPALDEPAFCATNMGSYSTTSACPTAGRVGRCTMTFANSTSTFTIRVSDYAPTTTLAARGFCPPAMPAANFTYTFEEN